MTNEITLGDEHPVTEELKPLKVGGKATSLETAQHGNGAKVNGNLEVTGNIQNVNTDRIASVGNTGLEIQASSHVEFNNCGVGFDLITPTYNASDTDVSFITGNKQFVTFGSGNIADLNLKFPATSGNFTLLLKQDGTGSRTVASDGWLAFDSDGNAANGSASVKFPGGTNPTLTTDANHVDIISFFWDADNEIAYGVASLDFQF